MKKSMLLVFILCTGFGELYSQNDSSKYESWDPVCVGPEPIYYFIGLNYGLISSDLMSKANSNSNNQFHSNYGIHLEYLLGDYFNSISSLKFGINLTNLGYNFQKVNLNQNYKLSYLSSEIYYKYHIFYSPIYVIGGVNLNYLYDVESKIQSLNVNNEIIEIKRDLSGIDISKNYNRFDLVSSIGVGYDILMEGYYFSLEPKYNFSLFNHINKSNEELKDMNFKNEFRSLNIGVTFAL